MEVLNHINYASLLDTTISLSGAFLLGGLIGLERQYRLRTAGLRTNVLVALGAAIFVDMANRLNGHESAVHVIAYVVSGIGFLGAGVIMREEGNVRGLNTAATLWATAAVGACAGADLLLEAILATAFILAANTLLRPLVNQINQQPLNTSAVEVTITVYVIASHTHKKEALRQLELSMAAANYQKRNLLIHAFGNDEVEIEAELATTGIDAVQLQHITDHLASLDCISQSFWSPSTTG